MLHRFFAVLHVLKNRKMRRLCYPILRLTPVLPVDRSILCEKIFMFVLCYFVKILLLLQRSFGFGS